MQKVRVFFGKKGRMKYISHLDLNRAVARMLMRSGLPVAFTEGFNPHAKVVFAVPLSIYQSSVCEVFDFSLTRDMPHDEVLEALRYATVPDLPITDVAEPIMPLGECAWARYEITVATAATAEQINELLKGEINVVKRTKKGEALTDISPMIRSVSARAFEGSIVIDCVAAAAPNNCLNVAYIVNYISGKYEVYDSSIARTALYSNNLELFA